MKSNKADFVERLQNLLKDKVAQCEKEVREMSASRDSATKSSAGDKHETGRAMMQIELENIMQQLAKARNTWAEFSQIDFSKEFTEAGSGALVLTNQGAFLIAVASGKIESKGQSCFSLSPASPLGQVLLGKKAGDEFQFMERLYRIEGLH